MNSSTDPAPLPASEARVLVTGGSGYVGSHVVSLLLEEGHRVRATVRSAAREDALRALVDEVSGAAAERLEVTVADLSSDDGWAAAMRDVQYVMHVASPFPAGAPEDEDELIRPARDGTLRVLAAARDAGVRRVVMTSSFAAVGYSTQVSGEYTEASWTDPADENTAYIRSKTIAERAAWDFMEREGGDLELTVINPVGVFGPVLSDHLSVSTGFVKAMLDGSLPAVPRMYFGVVDVRDVAEIHLAAMTHADAAGERFIAVSGASISFLEMAQVLARRLGEAASRVPSIELTDDEVREASKSDPSLRESVSQLGRVPIISNLKAKSVLGWEPRSVETTIVDTAQSLLDRGLVRPVHETLPEPAPGSRRAGSHSTETPTSDLRDLVVDAHGGMDRWNELSTVTLHMRAGGALWGIKGQDGVINDSTVRVDLHRQFVSHAPFGGPDLHDTYTPGRVTIENSHDEVLEQRSDPRAAFVGHSLETPWDRLHLAYFTGYAMWTYLTQPFSWLLPGVEVEELEPWNENGETWRRLRVVYPADIATHSAENLYYLDGRGLIRRHDYTTEVLGSTTPAAHYAFDHQAFDGVQVPTRRRVHLIGADGVVMPEPVVVSIDVDDVRFE